MKRLEVLTQRSRYPDAATFDGLLRADVFGRMKHLNLNYNRIDSFGAGCLVRGLSSPRLEILMLAHNRLEAGDIKRLMGCPGLRSLRHLSLRNNACGDEEIRELGNSPNLSSMETLGLRDVGGTTAGFEALLGSDKLPSLKH